MTGDNSVTVAFSAKFAKTVTVAVYRGVSTVTPIDVSSNGATAGGTSVTTPAITTSTANERLVVIDGENASATTGTWTAPTGFTVRATQAGGASVVSSIADLSQATAGSTGAKTSTFSVSGQLVSVLLAMKPAQLAFGYDTRGNRTSATPAGGTATMLSYDQANRLVAFGSTATYAYDGDGLRASKTVNGTAEAFTWNTADSVPTMLVDKNTNYVYGVNDRPLEQVSSTGTLYFHQDQAGSTRALTNSTGAVVGTYSYDAYGRLTGSTGTAANPLAFDGQYTDSETGLQYLRGRYLDPQTVQFLSRDPIDALTRQHYGFAANNPTTYSDPRGLVVESMAGGGTPAPLGYQTDMGVAAAQMGVSTAELTEAISTLGVVGSDVTVDTTSGWVFRTSDCWAYGQINTALLGIFTRDHQDDPAALRGLAAFGGALGIAAGAELAAASGDVATAAIGAVLVAGGSETTAAIFGAVLGGFTLGLGVAGIAVGAYVLYKVEAGN